MICPNCKEVIYVDNQEFINCTKCHELIYYGKKVVDSIDIVTVITDDNQLQE